MFNKLFQKFQPKSSFEKERRIAVKEILDKAYDSAVSEEEYDEWERLSLKNEDDTSSEELVRFDELDAKIKAATATFENINDFKYALQYFGVQDPIDDLAHENAHANKAEQLGVKFEYYYMRIFGTKDGRFIADIGASIDTEKDAHGNERDWGRFEEKEADIDITRAPDEYGNKMSPSDIDRLSRMDDMYKEE